MELFHNPVDHLISYLSTDDQQVTEGDLLSRIQHNFDGWVSRIHGITRQVVHRKEPISTGMWPAGVTGILRMIEDHQGNYLPLFFCTKGYPGSLYTPYLRFSFITLLIAVLAIHSLVVCIRNIGR